MAKSVTSLTGNAKDQLLRRLLAEVPGLDPAQQAQIGDSLARQLSRIWVRNSALETSPLASPQAAAPAQAGTPAHAFDPYSPNVVVVLRKGGRDSALAALRAISGTEQLRLLAREQQLGIEAGLSGADEIRIAIVAAAERRIANRRAAGS